MNCIHDLNLHNMSWFFVTAPATTTKNADDKDEPKRDEKKSQQHKTEQNGQNEQPGEKNEQTPTETLLTNLNTMKLSEACPFRLPVLEHLEKKIKSLQPNHAVWILAWYKDEKVYRADWFVLDDIYPCDSNRDLPENQGIIATLINNKPMLWNKLSIAWASDGHFKRADCPPTLMFPHALTSRQLIRALLHPYIVMFERRKE